MPTKAANPTPVQTIKWTEEEWKNIATRLFTINGPEILDSGLEQIKARDVFDAQAAVLPENRHRKLISLAQGFQAIRARLGMMMAEIAENAVSLNPPVAGVSMDSRLGRKGSRAAKEEDPGQQKLFSPDAGNVSEAQNAISDPQEQFASGPVAPETATAFSGRGTSLPDDDMQPGSLESTLDGYSKTAAANEFVKGGQTNSPHRAEKPQAAAGHFDQSAEVTMHGFLEQIRPFVSMVCDELARALVKTMTEQGAEGSLTSLMQSILKQSTPQQSGPGVREARKFTPRQDVDDQGMPDEDAFHEPQPLFDPKLPPSPNSEFKPTIGLVGASEYQTIDLQVQYPQLQLVSVSPDAVRIGKPFQRCQRVIGIQEEVPAPVNEFLGRILRHRYVRVSGGMDQVQEQLNSWLNGAGALNIRSTRTGPREGKGGTRNIYAKKRSNRYRP
jgi:hypothetical protein